MLTDSTAAEYFRFLISHLKPYRKRLAFGLGAVVLTTALEIASPMLLRTGINYLAGGGDLGYVYVLAGLLLLAAAVGGVFRYLMRYLIIGVSRFAESDVREGFFVHLLKLPPSFFDRHRTGDLMARATDDVERIRMVFGPALMQSANTLLVMAFSAAMMLYLDVTLAAMLLGLAPLVGGTVLLIARLLSQANYLQQETYGELSARVQENLSGIRVVKAFALEDREAERFRQVCRQYYRRSLGVARLDAAFMPALTFLVGVGAAAILWVGGSKVATGRMPLGDFVAFLAYLSLMTWPMAALGWVTHLYQRGKASHRRHAVIMQVAPQFPTSGGVFKPDPQQPRANPTSYPPPQVTFEGVRFRYREPGPEVLCSLSLTVRSGQTMAVVGRTGTGKSTLLRLVPRLYEPQSGRITVAGVDLKDWNPADLRALIGYVDQTPFLFSASVRENLEFGADGATPDAIAAAVRAAGMEDEIAALPNGYDTLLGERGVTLSGGQQQRLTLARAIVSNPPLLLLDDCLSAVDAETERRILDNLSRSHIARTIIFVTHRLAVAERADAVAVLAGGRVAEFGSHAELMELDGMYAEMSRRQRLAEEIGAMG